MHKPVLLDETIAGLNILPNGIYIDATFGRGGHSAAILQKLVGGRLIVIDKDPEAIAEAKERYDSDVRVSVHHGSFAALEAIAEAEGVLGKVDGVMMDLGVSSPQLDEARRGFSFMRDGPLDMRMDTSQGQTAEEYLQGATEAQLVYVLKEYGEERFAKRIAVAIKKHLETATLKTTKALADLVERTIPSKEKHKHPATRTFQALRIEINNELRDLKTVLSASLKVLKPGGRLCCISFHSLEDRIVKHFMQKAAKGYQPPKGMPLREKDIQTNRQLKVIGKALRAGESELNDNVRSRSAVLRIAEKLS